MRLTKYHRFGPSGLNLAFEMLLLVVSLRLHVMGTHDEPRELGFRFVMHSFTLKECLSSFVGRRRCHKSSSRDNEQPAETEAHGTARAEARGWRYRVSDQAKVVAQYLIGVLKSDLIM
jgi:hypothetical protein